MPFAAVCCCPFYSEWGFSDTRGLLDPIEVGKRGPQQLLWHQQRREAQHSKEENLCYRIDIKGTSVKRVEVEVSCSILFF